MCRGVVQLELDKLDVSAGRAGGPSDGDGVDAVVPLRVAGSLELSLSVKAIAAGAPAIGPRHPRPVLGASKSLPAASHLTLRASPERRVQLIRA
jgi:hypothetical protein